MKDKILKIRKMAKLSQADFGKRIGITGSSVSLIESGKNNPSDQTVKLICSEFDVNPDWMAGVEGAPMKLSGEDADLSAILRAMTGKSESKKQLLRIIADMPDELLDAFVAYLQTKKEPPQA